MEHVCDSPRTVFSIQCALCVRVDTRMWAVTCGQSRTARKADLLFGSSAPELGPINTSGVSGGSGDAASLPGDFQPRQLREALDVLHTPVVACPHWRLRMPRNPASQWSLCNACSVHFVCRVQRPPSICRAGAELAECHLPASNTDATMHLVSSSVEGARRLQGAPLLSFPQAPDPCVPTRRAVT